MFAVQQKRLVQCASATPRVDVDAAMSVPGKVCGLKTRKVMEEGRRRKRRKGQSSKEKEDLGCSSVLSLHWSHSQVAHISS